MKTPLSASFSKQDFSLISQNSLAKNAMFSYTQAMAIDRKKPLSDTEVRERRERHKEAAASSACEGIHLTEEEEALFAEFDRLGLSYDEEAKRIDEYLQEKHDIPPAPAT